MSDAAGPVGRGRPGRTRPARSDAGAEGSAKILTGNAVRPCRLRPEGRAAARPSLPGAAGIPELFVLSEEASGDERLARVTCRKQGADGARPDWPRRAAQGRCPR